MNTTLIIGYFVILMLIGYISSRKQTSDDFLIAKRNLNVWKLSSTITASFVGGTALVAYTAYAYEFGIGTVLGFVGILFGFTIFAKFIQKIHKLAHEENFHTISDYIEHRIDRKTAQLVSHVIVVIIALVLMNQFIAGTHVLVSISDFSYEQGLIISAVTILIYLLLGGFRSVVKTDIFQHVLVILLLAVIVSFMAKEVDMTFVQATANTATPGLLISFLVYGLFIAWYQPELWQRAFAAKDERTVVKSFVWSGVFLTFIGAGISLMGMATKLANPDIDPAQAIVYGVTNLVPETLLSLGIVLLFAVIMSAADTVIFVLSTTISKDYLKPKDNDQFKRFTRYSIISIIICASVLALIFRDIIDIALIKAGVGMSLVPTIIANFKTKLDPLAVKISVLGTLAYILYWVVTKNITPENMIAGVLVATVLLLIPQKILRRRSH